MAKDTPFDPEVERIACISCGGSKLISTGWDEESDCPVDRPCWVCSGTGTWPSFQSHPAEIAALVPEA